MTTLPVNYYYDHSGELTDDDEGCLVLLCDRCASKQGNAVAFASGAGVDEQVCAVCTGQCERCQSQVEYGDSWYGEDGQYVCQECWEMEVGG